MGKVGEKSGKMKSTTAKVLDLPTDSTPDHEVADWVAHEEKVKMKRKRKEKKTVVRSETVLDAFVAHLRSSGHVHKVRLDFEGHEEIALDLGVRI